MAGGGIEGKDNGGCCSESCPLAGAFNEGVEQFGSGNECRV